MEGSKSNGNDDMNFSVGDLTQGGSIDLNANVYRSVAVPSASAGRSLPDDVGGGGDVNLHGVSAVFRDIPSSDMGEMNYRGAAVGSHSTDLQMKRAAPELQMRGAAFGVSTDGFLGSNFPLAALDAPMNAKADFYSKPAGPSGGMLLYAVKPQINQTLIIPTPPALPDAPYFLERDTHDVTWDATTLYKKLDVALVACNVDFTFSASKWRFDCLAYPNKSRVDLVITAYSRSNGNTALEFQRRCGCCMSFRQLVNDLQCHLQLPGSNVKPRFFVPTMDMTMDDAMDDEKMSVDDISPIVEMIQSPFPDVQVEGVKIIASVAENPAHTSSLHQLKVIQTMVAEATKSQATDSEFRRCVASALHNYIRCGHPKATAESVASDGFVDLLVSLARNYSSMQDLEVQRQAAGALMEISKNSGAGRQVMQKHRAVLQQVLKETKCERLKDTLRSASN